MALKKEDEFKINELEDKKSELEEEISDLKEKCRNIREKVANLRDNCEHDDTEKKIGNIVVCNSCGRTLREEEQGEQTD